MTVSILIFLPVIAALAVLLFKNGTAKYAALGFAIAELAVAAVFLSKFIPDASVQFAIDVPWIPKLGIYFNAGIDGISMIMVLLTTVLVPLIILTTYKHEYKNASAFYALILFMQAGLLVVFTALDGFLFYVGWEAALIPIYFICALWGGENRIKVTIKFFIYTFSGSLFMLLGLIYLYLQTPAKVYDISQFYNLSLDAHHQGWVFWAFFIAFAIKMPVFPFHTWQPDTYTEAPSAGTMMLSGIMLKMGVYGAIRWLVPNAPLGFFNLAEHGANAFGYWCCLRFYYRIYPKGWQAFDRLFIDSTRWPDSRRYFRMDLPGLTGCVDPDAYAWYQRGGLILCMGYHQQARKYKGD